MYSEILLRVLQMVTVMRIREIIQNCKYFYEKIWNICKARVLLIFILALSDGLNVFITTFFFKFIIDGITSGRNYSYLVLIVVIRLSILFLYQCVDNILNLIIFPKQDNLIKSKILLELYEKIPKIDYRYYDKSDTYEKITKAVNEADNRAIWMLSSLSNLLRGTTQILVLAISLLYLSPLSVGIALVGMIVTFWGNIINSKKGYECDMAEMKPKRYMDYIKRVFYLPEYKNDIRTTNIDSLLKRKYMEETTELNKITTKYGKFFSAVSISASWLFNFLNVGISSLYVGFKIIKKQMSIGDFASVVTAIVTLSNNFLNYSQVLPQFKQHSLFINNYIDVMNLETTTYRIDHKNSFDEGISIRLENVNFRYENSNKVLSDINLDIHKGQKVAFVGENGAGKTTLIKLILRFYDPESGNIFYNNLNYKEVNVDSLYESLGYLAQNYNTYALTIAENICFEYSKDEEKIWNSLDIGGLKEKVSDLCDKLESQLTTEFSQTGINLSGGENQRLAISRAVYLNSSLLIMDEPSSALDARAESKLYDTIDRISNDRTVIVVSHQMSCVKKMDKIYYLENGRIEESGNHDELINLKGKYYEMYMLQAERYGIV